MPIDSLEIIEHVAFWWRNGAAAGDLDDVMAEEHPEQDEEVEHEEEDALACLNHCFATLFTVRT